MYVDASEDCNDLVFYLGNSGYSYNIRITQYNCEYENRAPRGCTEYLFGAQTGFIYTYNWDSGKYKKFYKEYKPKIYWRYLIFKHF